MLDQFPLPVGFKALIYRPECGSNAALADETGAQREPNERLFYADWGNRANIDYIL